jgi:pantothenate synthetase
LTPAGKYIPTQAIWGDENMCSEELIVQLECENILMDGKLNLYEEAPDDNEQVLIEIYFHNQKVCKMAENFFRALQALRHDLEKINVQIICNGAAKNVYPSPMQLSMGSCRTAYMLQLGHRARSSDIVDIFECMNSLECVNVKRQEEFYSRWLKSLAK